MASIILAIIALILLFGVSYFIATSPIATVVTVIGLLFMVALVSFGIYENFFK